MNHYPRLPVIVVLVAFAGLATFYARPWSSVGESSNGRRDLPTIEQLETVIASGTASSKTWGDYGQRLYDARQFSRAALAYEKVIEIEPYHRPARFQRALALARANNIDGLLSLLQSELHIEPKLVVEILQRAEVQPLFADGRFAALQIEAIAQAMD